MEFSDILREILSEYGYTQKELADKIGVKQSQISEWLKGKANPGYDSLRAMAKNLPVNADFLLGLEEDLF